MEYLDVDEMRGVEVSIPGQALDQSGRRVPRDDRLERGRGIQHEHD